MRKQLLKLLGVIMISVVGLSCNMDEDNFALNKPAKEEILKDQLEQIASKYNVGLFYNDTKFGKKRIDLIEFEKQLAERVELIKLSSFEDIPEIANNQDNDSALRVFPRKKKAAAEHHNYPYDGTYYDQRFVDANNRSYWVEMSISWHWSGPYGRDYVSEPTFEVVFNGYYLSYQVSGFDYIFRGANDSFAAFCTLIIDPNGCYYARSGVYIDYDGYYGMGYVVYTTY